MTDALPFPSRRAVLALLASLPVTARAGMASPVATPLSAIDAATVLVAGPDGGLLDRWSRVVQPALAQALPPDTALTRASVGGPDGVTGANQFATRGDPDGRTVMLTPGDAAMAWLIGDPRAKYDPGRWTSLMTCVTPGVLVVRAGALRGKKPVRIAIPGLASTSLAGVLALEILGARPELVAPPRADSPLAAFSRGATDAVFVLGHNVPDQVRALIQVGGEPVLTTGGRADSGLPTRDEAFPSVPVLTEIVSAATPLMAAYQAAATASGLEFALVLPQLTPAARVALWRQAATEAAGALNVQVLAMAVGARAIGGVEATVTANAVVAPPPALMALRQWLASRFNFRPA